MVRFFRHNYMTSLEDIGKYDMRTTSGESSRAKKWNSWRQRWLKKKQCKVRSGVEVVGRWYTSTVPRIPHTLFHRSLAPIDAVTDRVATRVALSWMVIDDAGLCHIHE